MADIILTSTSERTIISDVEFHNGMLGFGMDREVEKDCNVSTFSSFNDFTLEHGYVDDRLYVDLELEEVTAEMEEAIKLRTKETMELIETIKETATVEIVETLQDDDRSYKDECFVFYLKWANKESPLMALDKADGSFNFSVSEDETRCNFDVSCNFLTSSDMKDIFKRNKINLSDYF